jgi:hypothetical protein
MSELAVYNETSTGQVLWKRVAGAGRRLALWSMYYLNTANASQISICYRVI